MNSDTFLSEQANRVGRTIEQGPQDLLGFLTSLPSGLLPVEISCISMSFLMHKQYGADPPDPCPCY